MAEGFIIRKGGMSKRMKKISSTFSGNATNSITIPQLIGCKCFYICANQIAINADEYKTHSLSYFDGISVGVFVFRASTINVFIQATDRITFDENTGVITVNGYSFNPSVVYTWWAYVEEE